MKRSGLYGHTPMRTLILIATLMSSVMAFCQGETGPSSPAGMRRAVHENGLTTNLLRAAHNGDARGVTLLIERGADANAQDARGVSALFLAAERGHTDIVKLLLERGARVNMSPRSDPATGCLPLTPLMAASANGHAEVVRVLLSHGADISAEAGETAAYPTGATALYLAAVKGHADVVTIINEAGTSGEWLWKYMVIAIWVISGLLLMSKRITGQ